MTYPTVSEVQRGSAHRTIPTYPSISGNPTLTRAVNLAIWSRWISSAIRVSQLPQV